MIIPELYAQEAGTSVKAGVAAIDITPADPVSLAGYASRDDLSTGVHDSLSARVVAFEQNGRQLVLVSTDILGFYGASLDAIRGAITEANSLEPHELFLSATHTHSGPQLAVDEASGHPNNVQYIKLLGARLAEAVREARQRSGSVQIGVGSGSSPVGVSRRERVVGEDGTARVVLGRNPEAMTDREVQVITVEPVDEGQPAAVMFSYGVHSTALGPQNYLISGDVHGLAAQFVEKQLGQGAIAPAFAGASGDIDPWYRVLPEFREDEGWIAEPVLLGKLLGVEVIHVTEGIEPAEVSGPIETATKALELPAKSQGEEESTQDSETETLNVAVGRVGDIAFVCLGGEIINAIGRDIKAASPFPTTFVVTHCNGAAGYLPTRDFYEEGGYEVGASRFGPAAADLVIAEAVRLLHALLREVE